MHKIKKSRTKLGDFIETWQLTDDRLNTIKATSNLLLLVIYGRITIWGQLSHLNFAHTGDLIFLRKGEKILIENADKNNNPYTILSIAHSAEYQQEYCQNLLYNNQTTEIPCSQIINTPLALQTLIRKIDTYLNNSEIPPFIVGHRLFEILLWAEGLGFHLHDRPNRNIKNAVIRIIEKDLGRSWKISEIANKLGMSEITLRRRLKAEETSFSQIIHNLRLHHGFVFLKTTTMTITEISYICGFCNPSRFSKAIKDRFNLSPREISQRTKPHSG
jgi:AraC-like DNA-binding protein